MKKIKFMCAQPAIRYYAWQVEVMINNFIKNNINPHDINVVCAVDENNEAPVEWMTLQKHFKDVNFFFYEDTRILPSYVSSIRPHILKKHFNQYPSLQDNVIFYHDCDVLFVHPINFNQFLQDDVWYLSDTEGYIGAEYIKSKKYNIYDDMCTLVGIDNEIPTKNQKNTGGAQYIMKNIDYNFWNKVEIDCEKLYTYFLEKVKQYPPIEQYHPIQEWTADMWAVLWNAWLFGHDTQIHEDLQFSWASSLSQFIGDYNIFHNSGITERSPNNCFRKHDYINKFPYNIKEEDFCSEYCSIFYVQEIIETSKKSCLL